MRLRILTAHKVEHDGRIALVIQGIGALFGLLAAFRIWQVYGALRFGEAQAAEVVEARVGRARISLRCTVAHGPVAPANGAPAGPHVLAQRETQGLGFHDFLVSFVIL